MSNGPTHTQASADTGDLSRPRALAFGATLSLAACIGLFPPHALGALSPFIIPDLEISRTLYGSLGTAAFGAAALLSPVAGAVVDRMGARTALMGLFGIATAAFATFGNAHAYAVLLLAVCLAGAPTALTNPSATSMVLQAVPPRRRTRFLGIAQTGPPLAALVAGFLLPVGAVTLGWRTSVLLVAAAAAVGVIATYLVMPGQPPVDHGSAEPRTRRGRKRDREFLLSQGDLRLGSYAFLMNIAIVPVTVYVPLYAFENLGWTQGRAALLTGVLGVTSLVGRLLWSTGAGHARGVAIRMTLLPIVAATGLGLIAVAAPFGAAWVLWLGVATFGSSAMAWTVLTMLAVMVRPSQSRGRAGRSAGAVMLFGFLGGAVGPLVFGMIVDGTGSYTPAWALGFLALTTNVLVSRTGRTPTA